MKFGIIIGILIDLPSIKKGEITTNTAKKTFFLTTGCMLISIIYSLFVQAKFLLSFINSYFILGMVCLLLGLIVYVKDGGFFSFFKYSYGKFLNSIRKRKTVEEEYGEIEDDPHAHVDFQLKLPLVLTGSIMLAVTYSVTIFLL